jgi:hypothetical protein
MRGMREADDKSTYDAARSLLRIKPRVVPNEP